MNRLTRLLLGALLVLPLWQVALAQQDGSENAESPPIPSAMDAELFYQLLVGELDAQGGEPTAAFERILEAARKTSDPQLYRRAIEIAFQARSGESALRAARAWTQAQPRSREANRYVLQTLLLLNRVQETVEPLKADIALADAKDRQAAINGLPRIYARVSDKKAAASVVERGLADYLTNATTGAAAWTTVGRLRLSAGDNEGALDAARRGQALSSRAEGPALLALEVMDPKVPLAEALVRKYLEGKPTVEVRMGYARALLDAQRYPEALQQLEAVTAEKPDFAEAWLVQGSLLAQDYQMPAAETALKRYVQLAQSQSGSQDRSAGLAQAYLQLSQIAEKRDDYALAGAWLDKIENSQDLVAAQTRRASILARQGHMDEARKLIRSIPERGPTDARLKVMAELNLLRDNKQFQAAYDLLAQELAKDASDTDLVYEQAMLAEKVGNLAEMERLLRQIIASKPDYHHAYNALGYSLAERNERLPEAKQLIERALEFAPGDPFISDSLGWVEFRLGNKAEAVRILEAAYKSRPDPEIAAHLGEVLWSVGQHDRAQSVFREGLLLAGDNETLLETLKRLKVKP